MDKINCPKCKSNCRLRRRGIKEVIDSIYQCVKCKWMFSVEEGK